MKTINAIILSFAIAGSLLGEAYFSPAHAQGCLGPAQQQQAINSGKAKRFGVIARSVSRRLNATVLNGQLCKRGGRLIYILTIIKKNGQTGRAAVDAKSGR